MSSLASVIIPVKPGGLAKTRFGGDAPHRSALAEAIALDTVTAALAGRAVGDVIVVGGLAQPVVGVRVIDDPGGGLHAAIVAGLAAVASAGPTAVLLGDLPALQPSELDSALAAAARHERAFVPDAEGTGTTLIVARAEAPHSPRFGADSAARHRAAGYAQLELPAHSGLRRDVDTREQLSAAASLTVGERTRALLSTR